MLLIHRKYIINVIANINLIVKLIIQLLFIHLINNINAILLLYLQRIIKKSSMRIKELIKEKGLTVKEVAERMGVVSPALSRVINGNPTVEMLGRIAIALEVDIRDLFEGHDYNIYGLVQHNGQTYKIDSLDSLRRLLSLVETNTNNVIEK